MYIEKSNNEAAANYISLSEAARLSGYTADYVGKLCRGKWVRCRRSGRKWEVDAFSLTEYLASAKERKDRKHKILALRRKREYVGAERAAGIAGKPEKAPVSAIPVTQYAPYASGRFSAFSIAVVLVVVSSYMGLIGMVPGASVAQVGSASVPLPSFEDMERIAHRWYLFVRSFSAGAGAEERIGNSPDHPDPSEPAQGMVVIPDHASGTQNLDAIRNSFSDEVEVHPTGAGSGYVTPVFGDDAGDAYWYTLVPVYQQEDREKR